MQYLQLLFFLCVSLLKGAGSYFAFIATDQLVRIAYTEQGGWLICYGLAIVAALLGVWCIVECFIEFSEILNAFFDEDDGVDQP